MTPVEMREAAAKAVEPDTDCDCMDCEVARQYAAAIRALPIPLGPTMADCQRMTDPLLTDPEAFDAYMEANPLPDDPPVEAMAEALRLIVSRREVWETDCEMFVRQLPDTEQPVDIAQAIAALALYDQWRNR